MSPSTSTVKDRRWRVYLLEALVFGLPTMLQGGFLAVIFLFSALGDMDFSRALEKQRTDLALLALAACGGVGCAAWCRLSWGYLRHGLPGLVRLHWAWWSGLLAGMAAASLILPGVVGALGCRNESDCLAWPLRVFFAVALCFWGPALLVPSFHLIWMRLVPGRAIKLHDVVHTIDEMAPQERDDQPDQRNYTAGPVTREF